MVSEGDVAKVNAVLAVISKDQNKSDTNENKIVDIKLNNIPNNAPDAKIVRVRKKAGDTVKAGDVLFDIEGKKGSSPIKAQFSGVLQEILIEEAVTAKKGEKLATLRVSNNQPEKSAPKINIGGYNILIKPKKQQDIESDIAIIGGGPGGYVAALHAAKLGAKVVLVEMDKVGGTCLNRGCIPTKALVRSAEVLNNLKEAEEFGCFAENINFDMKKVLTRKNNIVNKLVTGIHYLLQKKKVTLVTGVGTIKDAKTIIVKNGNSETIIKAKHIIISTGSKTAELPVPCAKRGNLIFSEQALELTDLPQKMTIIGGGVIGMEFAFIFKSFGVDVTVIEYMDNVLSVLDDDICKEITTSAKEKGINIFTGSKVEEIIKSEDTGCIVKFVKDDEYKFISADKVLISVGRKPYIDGLGINKLGIELNDKKRGIKVNEKMQTNVDNIYAIGDVTNKLQLAHVASHQGIVAVNNIMGVSSTMDYGSVPSAIFTMPEIAVVGVSEKTAAASKIEIEVGKFPFNANGKALTLGEARGFVKIIKEKSTGKIIGSAIIGPHATDLIAELTLAIKNGLTAKQITETIHAHPTTAEAVHEAALAVEGGALHFAQ
ncbi:dihydrolipoyl dehydrogenase [Clostridium sp. 'deep sea']|nr:dihydrolipoyl dehydrogenase [Clostridium sp. 'deep sea']